MVNWHRSIEEACERLVAFTSSCKLDDVKSIQQLQFALADFEAEFSMALASSDAGQSPGSSNTLKMRTSLKKTTGDSAAKTLPQALYNLVYHKDACLRIVGWRAFTHLVKSKLPILLFNGKGSDKEAREESKRLLVHLVRALDGGLGCSEEQLQAMQLILALCTSPKYMDSSEEELNGLWTLVLPSIVHNCEFDDEESESAGGSGVLPYNPRVLLKALQVLRNIATHLPQKICNLKHIRPLLSTLCTLSFLDANKSYALNLEESQREAIASASEYTLSSLLSNVTFRRNLGWDISTLLGQIISPFMNIAIAQAPDREEDVMSWDQLDTLRILPHCMQGLFRLSRTWTGIYLLTKHTKTEKSIVELLVQAFGDTKGDIVRCAFIILFSGLLGLPVDDGAAKYWIEHTGISFRFDDIHCDRESGANRMESYPSSSFQAWDIATDVGTGAENVAGSISELSKRVHKSVLVNAIYEAGLHYHLKHAMKEKVEPKRSIPLLLEGILEMAHGCLSNEKLISMQGSHNAKDEDEEGTPFFERDELPDINYLVTQSEIKGSNGKVNKLQRIVLSSNASSTSNTTAQDERKTIMKTLTSNKEQGSTLQSIDEFKLGGESNDKNSTEIDDKLQKLQQLMEDSGVLKYSSAYWKKWNWDYITLVLDFCKGNPEDGIKLCMRSKLLKRLFAFYAKRLPKVPIENYKGRVGVHCGMRLIKLMIETEEGMNFLCGKSSFLDQLPEVNVMDIVTKGLQLEIGHPKTNKGRIFHAALVNHTHAFGLLQMALQIQGGRKGIHLLYRLGIAQALEEVVEAKSNLELCKMIFAELNLFVNDFPQKIVSKALASDSSLVVNYAILCLKRNLLMLPDPSQAVDDSTRKTISWFAKLFVRVLQIPDKRRQSYVAILAAKFCSLGYTKYLLNAGIKDTGDALMAHPILIQQLLLHPDGYSFVNGKDWLENLVMSQFSEEKTAGFIEIINGLFVSNMQRSLQHSTSDLSSSFEKDLLKDLDGLGTDLYLKNVFYALSSTKDGSNWLLEHQIIEMLVERIEDTDEKDVNRKAFLWYMGLIASAGENIAEKVIQLGGIDTLQFIAMTSSDFMLRGEALVAMNIACTNKIIAEHVNEQLNTKWVVFEVDSRIKNKYTTLCLPQDMHSYLNLVTKRTMLYIQSWCASHRQRKSRGTVVKANLRREEDSISTAFGKLGNSIAEEEGKLGLAKLKRSSPEKFTMPNMSILLHQLLTTLDIPKSARTFMWDIID